MNHVWTLMRLKDEGLDTLIFESLPGIDDLREVLHNVLKVAQPLKWKQNLWLAHLIRSGAARHPFGGGDFFLTKQEVRKVKKNG